MDKRATRLVGWILWPLIRGSSVVTFDREKKRVIKTYNPRVFIRILHFLAVQKWTFIYETDIGLQIAGYRREIANFVLQWEMNGKCRVAPFLEVEQRGNRLAFVTEFIEGRQPQNQSEVLDLLEKLTALYVQAGLPTWSICPSNPRAYTNIIIATDGTPVIVDLESLLLNICIPAEELWDNLKAGNFPPHDDLYFLKLWSFYHRIKDVQEDDGERFRHCLEECELLIREQKGHQIRIWSRILNITLTLFRANERSSVIRKESLSQLH